MQEKLEESKATGHENEDKTEQSGVEQTSVSPPTMHAADKLKSVPLGDKRVKFIDLIRQGLHTKIRPTID